MFLRKADIKFDIIISLIIILSGGFFNPVFATVTITAAGGGTNISADTNIANGTATWTTLTGPTITEGANRDIQSSGTFILNAPTGFSFNTGATVTATITRIAGSSTCFAFNSNTATPTATTITFTANARDGNGSGGTTRCEVAFSNIQIRPTAGTPLATGNLTNTGTNSGFLGGANNYGTLTEIVGAFNHIAVTPSGPQTVNGGSTINFSAQGYDVNNNPISGLTFTWAVIPGTGTGTVSSDGILTGNKAGTLAITATNGALTGSSGIVTVSNVWPVADGQSVSTDEDTPILINLSATDANGDTLNYSINSDPSSGSLSELNPLTGAVTYNPSANYSGPDSFTFIANDGVANSGIGTVFITVNSINDPPAMNSIGDKNGDEELVLTFTISASDPENNTLTYSASNLPSGASFNADNQTFYWTPDYSQSGVYDSVHFEVTDGFLTASEDITITIANVNRPPTLDIIGNKTGNENEELTFTVLASDPDNDTLSYSASNLPSGATFDTDTQTFSWIPDFDQSGNYLVTFTVSDGEFEDSEDVPIDIGNVNRSPELSAIGNQTTDEDQLLTFTVSASDLDSDTLTYSASNLPDGANFDADTQTFSWTPDYSQSGIYDSVHFEATDGFATDAEDISITVNNVNREPTLDSIGNQSGSENSNLTFTISGSDPDSDTLIYSASNLPSGATFDADTQTFSWTPSPIQSGTYDNVYFEISDNSAIASENITITIDNANQAPALDSIGNKNSNEGSALTFTISATDSDNDALTYSTSNLPSGATFDANTRTFSWTPDYSQSGSYPLVHFDVGDGLATTSEDITITIANANRTPILDAIGNKTINENQLLTFAISGSDPENDALTYSASNLPAGATFDTSAKTFNWTPGYSQAGSYPSVHFEVTDGSLTTSEDITITANNVSQDDGGVFYSAISLPTPQVVPIQNTQIAPTLTNPVIPVLENISPLVAITQPNSFGPVAQDQKPAEQPLISRTSAPIANQNPTAVSETPAQNTSLLANIAGFVKNPNIIENITEIYQRLFQYLKGFF